MIKISVINRKEKLQFDAYQNEVVLDVLRRNGIYIPASCGGNGSCKKCKIKYLGKEVLACEQKVHSGLEVELITQANSALEESLKRNYQIEAEEGYGIAIDLGTTTIASYLLNLENGVELGSVSDQNRQSAFGADIISRIKKASEGHLDSLTKTIINQINNMITDFKIRYKITEIKRITIAANTTMLHLLAHVDPSSMGHAPYQPSFLERKVFSGESLALDALEVILLPSISAFLGSDIVAGVLACDIFYSNKNILFCDLGTNGEIILKTRTGLYGTSTAAGPAFEGAKIECGMAGVSGALSKVSLSDEKLNFETINNQKLRGICGSGLVDLISLLLEIGIIDETGAIDSGSKSKLNQYLKEDKFYLSDDIYLSQKDIREFQLAKSAIASGILTLIDEVGLKVEEIDLIYLAGGFGFYINKENATRLGILPESLNDKIISVGNSSGLGAKMCLVNNKYLSECDLISENIKIIELSNNPHFSNYFIENMIF